jgi:predicted nucleic acid-binding protein
MITLVIDANVLVGELLRYRGQELIKNSTLVIYTTEKVLDETQYELQKRIAIRIKKNGLSSSTGQEILEAAQNLIRAC